MSVAEAPLFLAFVGAKVGIAVGTGKETLLTTTPVTDASAELPEETRKAMSAGDWRSASRALERAAEDVAATLLPTPKDTTADDERRRRDWEDSAAAAAAADTE
jgi:hypothetical protein